MSIQLKSSSIQRRIRIASELVCAGELVWDDGGALSASLQPQQYTLKKGAMRGIGKLRWQVPQ